MRALKLLFLVVLALPVSAVSAESLSDAGYLRKLSLHLRGVEPKPSEYQELKSIRSHAESENFFDLKVDEYLGSPLFADKMIFKLSELFQLKTKAFLGVDQVNNDYSMVYTDRSTLDDSLIELFRRISSQNLPWDNLLLNKSYKAYPNRSFSGGLIDSDISFFRLALPSLPNIGNSVVTPGSGPQLEDFKDAVDVSFDENDPRIAGALTTRRFLSRFNTTAINKNRKRAAAVFRIFLCDPMFPAIETGGDRKHEFIDATFAKDFSVTEDMISRNIQDAASLDRHGSDSQCMACHSKLDPLGRTFQGSGNVLHPEAFGGSLFYPRSSTENVHIKGEGIGDLAAAISEQPEYEQCQVSWFWKEFIGKDVPLTKSRQNELVGNFNSVERRTKDFIKTLVRSNEFRNKPDSNAPINFLQVQPLLKRCDSCHAKEPAIPLFSKLPIGFVKSAETQSEWLLEMQRRLSLPQGHKDKMPKDAKNWISSDLNLLLQWLDAGAHDDEGKPMILNRDIPAEVKSE